MIIGSFLMIIALSKIKQKYSAPEISDQPAIIFSTELPLSNGLLRAKLLDTLED